MSIDTALELFAAIFGFLAVYFTIKQNIWCWYVGLVQVTLYCYIFYTSKLYSDMILHIIYIFLNAYGWYSWKYGGPHQSTLRVTLMTKAILWIAVTLIGTLVLGFVMKTNTDASYPYPDAFTTVASLVAQYLMIKKILGSWFFWIVVDVVAIGIYSYKGLYFTSALYVAFLVMAIIGYFEWRKTFKAELQYAN